MLGTVMSLGWDLVLGTRRSEVNSGAAAAMVSLASEKPGKEEDEVDLNFFAQSGHFHLLILIPMFIIP